MSALGLHGEEVRSLTAPSTLTTQASPISKLAAPEHADKDAPRVEKETMQPQLTEKESQSSHE